MLVMVFSNIHHDLYSTNIEPEMSKTHTYLQRTESGLKWYLRRAEQWRSVCRDVV